MKRFYSSLLIIVFSVLIIGCGDEFCEGEVIDKEFLPQYTSTILISHVIYNGYTSTTILTPIMHNYPDRWKLTINCTDGKKREVYVTQECFDSVAIGDWFTYDPEYCSYDEPCTKTPVDSSLKYATCKVRRLQQ